MLAYALSWAVFMGLLAQVRIPLPFTPVPFTMQVFGVLLGGVLLGPAYGVVAQFAYVSIGIVGVPWFQGYHGGLAYFLGPTGGYLLAYPLASAIVSVAMRWSSLRPMVRCGLGMLAGTATIYAIGAVWLSFAIHVSLARAVVLGVAPFVLLDVLKAAGATLVAWPFVPTRLAE